MPAMQDVRVRTGSPFVTRVAVTPQEHVSVPLLRGVSLRGKRYAESVSSFRYRLRSRIFVATCLAASSTSPVADASSRVQRLAIRYSIAIPQTNPPIATPQAIGVTDGQPCSCAGVPVGRIAETPPMRRPDAASARRWRLGMPRSARSCSVTLTAFSAGRARWPWCAAHTLVNSAPKNRMKEE